MKNRSKTPYIFLFAMLLACAGILFAQGAPDRTLYVNGKSFGTVTQIGGRSYVDVDTLAQIVGGMVRFDPNRILITYSAPEAGTNPIAAAPAAPQGLSKDFARLAIGELAEMREWRGAIGTILTYGTPVVGSWPQDYHDRVNADLAQVAIAATTAADQDALQLLRNEFGNLAQWTGDVVSTRQSMNATRSVDPNAAQNDQMLGKISDCARFLSSMLVSGSYSDNASCH